MSIGDKETRAGPGVCSQYNAILARQGTGGRSLFDLISYVIGISLVLRVHIRHFVKPYLI
jgi:hypothetical protein